MPDAGEAQMLEVVIVEAVRTPVGRHGGALATIRPDDLAALVIKEVVARAGIEPDLIEDVYLGCTNQAGCAPRDWMPSTRTHEPSSAGRGTSL